MSLLRAIRPTNLGRLTASRPVLASQKRPYAEQSSASQKDPEPKILNRSPPKDEDAPKDVKQHNEEMLKRADRPNEKVKDEDVEKDKVPRGFWSGKLLAVPTALIHWA